MACTSAVTTSGCNCAPNCLCGTNSVSCTVTIVLSNTLNCLGLDGQIGTLTYLASIPNGAGGAGWQGTVISSLTGVAYFTAQCDGFGNVNVYMDCGVPAGGLFGQCAIVNFPLPIVPWFLMGTFNVSGFGTCSSKCCSTTPAQLGFTLFSH